MITPASSCACAMMAAALSWELCAHTAAASVPTLTDMAGSWIDLTRPVSAHVNSTELDLPMIANFHGSVGSSPNGDWGVSHTQGGVSHFGVRPVDLFAINSLEIPPFVGCGNSAAHGTANGCGRMLIGGDHVAATSTRYRADEVARRGSAANGLAVDSRMRMLFEQAGVLWQINLTNPSNVPTVATDVTFELSAMVNEVAHVAWVQPLPYDPANFSFSALSPAAAAGGATGLRGAISVGKPALATPALRPAASLFGFAGGSSAEEAPPEIDLRCANTFLSDFLIRKRLLSKTGSCQAQTKLDPNNCFFTAARFHVRCSSSWSSRQRQHARSASCWQLAGAPPAQPPWPPPPRQPRHRSIGAGRSATASGRRAGSPRFSHRIHSLQARCRRSI
jgi:hypothetical protein